MPFQAEKKIKHETLLHARFFKKLAGKKGIVEEKLQDKGVNNLFMYVFLLIL